jgi:hypothetical protein
MNKYINWHAESVHRSMRGAAPNYLVCCNHKPLHEVQKIEGSTNNYGHIIARQIMHCAHVVRTFLREEGSQNFVIIS